MVSTKGLDTNTTQGKLKADFNIKMNCRIEELQEEEQLTIVRLVNNMASLPDDYRKSAFKRLLSISQENPWTDDIPGLDKEEFLKNHPA